MPLNIQEEREGLQEMTVRQLRREYARLFGEESRVGNKVYLVKRIIWRKQVLAEGDISERARRRAAELADEADLRVRAPRGAFGPAPALDPERTVTRPFKSRDSRLPAPGAELVRTYKGRKIVARVLDSGFRCEGKTYPSLSAVVREVTGTNWNGFDFFGLMR